MRRATLSAALAVVMSWSLAAQRPVDPPPERPAPKASSTGKPSQYAITVKGCIDAKRLRLADSEAAKLPFEMLRGTEFTLNGSRDLLRLIRGHNGHSDEIAGVVSVPPTRRPVVPSVDNKKLGPFSVGVGGKESIGVDEAPRVLTLKVESLTHLSETCGEQR
jgi:hypothetical protein